MSRRRSAAAVTAMCASGSKNEGEEGGARSVSEGEALLVRKALAGVARNQGRAGLTAVSEMLHGTDNERLRRLGLTELTTHGLLEDHPKAWVLALLRRLITAGLVDLTTSEFPIPYLTGPWRREHEGRGAGPGVRSTPRSGPSAGSQERAPPIRVRASDQRRYVALRKLTRHPTRHRAGTRASPRMSSATTEPLPKLPPTSRRRWRRSPTSTGWARPASSVTENRSWPP